MKLFRIFSFFMLMFLLFQQMAGIAFAENGSIPAPVGDIYIQDFANILSQQEEMELRNVAINIEGRTTAQIAVLTLDTVGEQSIQEFANEAFRQYGIGNQVDDNGVLIVIAMNDRQIWVEVGYGLEGRLPDGKVGRILDQYAIPFLQAQQPNRAVMETYKVLATEVLAEYGEEGLPSGAGGNEVGNPQAVAGGEGVHIPVWLIIIIGAVVVFLDFKFFGGVLTHIFLSILARRGGHGGGGNGGFRGGGGGSSGGGGAGRGW